MSLTLPQETAVPRPAPRRGLVAAIGLAELFYAAAGALPLILGLSLKIQEMAPQSKETALGLVTALGGVATVIANPLSGHLSDRTTSRYGMRRPWILGGSLVGLAGLLVLALAGSIAMVAIGWMVAVTGYQAMVAGLTATVVDQFPAERRVRVAGVFSMCNMLGVVPAMVLSQAFKGELLTQFTICGGLAVTAAGVLCALLPDRRLDPAERRTVSVGGLASALLVLPRHASDYRLLWIQRLLVSIGFALIASYSLYYLQSRVGVPTADAVALVGLTTIASTLLSGLFAYLGGRWSARVGRGRPFVLWATTILAAMLLLKAVTASVGVVVVVAVVSGAATGVYYAVDLGLVTQVLPDERDAGRYLGAFAMAKHLPGAVAPAVAPILLAVGSDPFAEGPNYFLLFLVCGLLTLVAAPLVGLLRDVR
ncbi:MFS transporter [Streptosporangium carneum]|uniref:MFS transporter n=1 Tax=Streptosporangium carneum TaxID=47481 RepID=A0A9W6IBE8_9ACTN|nr:MFS transporter [Streptosporangium carneum]GLK14390.1 MFS transporter [Streptosporangium carneum]